MEVAAFCRGGDRGTLSGTETERCRGRSSRGSGRVSWPLTYHAARGQLACIQAPCASRVVGNRAQLKAEVQLGSGYVRVRPAAYYRALCRSAGRTISLPVGAVSL
jgi:hypothetical protein